MDQQKPLFFFIFLLLYVAIFLLNSLLIAIIYSEKTLHNPMYIFVLNLSCNGIFGSTSLIPHLLFNLTTERHRISLTNCLIQIFCLHTYNIIELNILAFMSYDRYAAICYPLHYHAMMSTKKLQTIMILFSYAQILYVCLFSSKECKAKAIQTCTPHLLAVLNYFVGIFFEIIQSRFSSKHFPYVFPNL
ncbi:olfactory receptor 4P4-like [Silurus meridionalis]|uniref:olfactory receptor 4P4-like n=1 Tax=Silurus meridionalis TaxID=175797 RepID=UPI001EEB3269|nr:olfactory receptor 4P4-like [Silurus meridionalis]